MENTNKALENARALIPGFDPEKEKRNIVGWVKNWFAENGPKTNAVIGISGGKDSTIAAGILCEAIGPERVYGILMPDGRQHDIEDALAVADKLGIQKALVNIGDVTTAFLRAMEDAEDPITGKSANLRMTDNAETNMPPRVRMAVLRAACQTVPGKGMLCNTCNRSEDHVGYSTKDGDASGDFSPLSNYTVTELLAIGHTMNGIPGRFIDKAPADGLCGKTDEDRFGFTYAVLDRYILTGQCDDPSVKAKIDRMHAANLHKLKPMPSCPKSSERPRERPFTKKEMKEACESGNPYMSGIVTMDANDAISGKYRLEGFLDRISVLLTGTNLLMDINYEVVGFEDGNLLIKVSGDVSETIGYDA